jgi:hypothetical protein
VSKSTATRTIPPLAPGPPIAAAATSPIISAKPPRTKIIPRIAIAKTPPLKISLGLHLPHLVGQPLLLANNRAATQTDTPLVIDADALHRHRIANATHIVNPVDPAIIELRNVNQPLFTLNTLNKSTKIFDRFHSAVVRFSYFYI